jgi:hypothetical protein
MKTAPLSEIIQHLASGCSIRTEYHGGHDHNDHYVDLGRIYVDSGMLDHLIREGWLMSFNGGYRLTDAGLARYLRSTDERFWSLPVSIYCQIIRIKQ